MLRCFRRLLRTLLLLAGVASQHGSALESQAAGDFSSIELIALSLADEPSARAEFARIALSEMAYSLLAETELARQQMQASQRQASLRRWIVYVERYVDELLRLVDSIDAATPIAIAAGPDGVLLLTLRRQSIMVSAPRMELQPSFEQQLVDRFCADYPCQKPASNIRAMPSVTAATPPRWSFSEGVGPSCVTDDGLVLQFETMTSLSQKREFCLQLVAELRVIASAIARERARGVVIDWRKLALHGIPGREQYQLDLNPSGDSLQLAVPRTAAIPGLLAQVQAWLRARSASRQYTLVLDNAEQIYAL